MSSDLFMMSHSKLCYPDTDDAAVMCTPPWYSQTHHYLPTWLIISSYRKALTSVSLLTQAHWSVLSCPLVCPRLAEGILSTGVWMTQVCCSEWSA